jgi:uncharacterized protein YndB with AHSA1/START domain
VSTITEQKQTTQVYRVFIRATPQAVWDAITTPEWTERYGYGGTVEYEMKQGGSYRHLPSAEMVKAGEEHGFPVPDVIIDGEVLEVDPPKRLVHTWHFMMAPDLADDAVGTITYELEELEGGVTRLTLIHELDGAPATALMVSSDEDPSSGGGGWAWVLSDLKTLLETGSTLAG